MAAVDKRFHQPRRLARPLSLLGVAAACLALTAAANDAAAQRFGPTQVEVGEVRADVVRSTINAIGIIRAQLTSTLRAEVEGQVKKFTIEPGDFVKSGQVICSINSSGKMIEVRAARAELKRAHANLEKLRRGARREVIAERRAEMENKRAHAERLRLKLERADALHQEKVISLNDVQDARLNHEAGLADFRRAQARYQEAVAGSRAEDLLIAEAEVASRQAALDARLDELRKFSVRAPFDGFIALRHTEIGQYLKEGDPIVDLLRLAEVYAGAEINEKQLRFIRIKMLLEVRADAYPGEVFEGQVAHIYPRANAATRGFPVTALVANPKHRLKDGMFVRLNFILDERQVNLVAKDALVNRDGPVVFVLDGSPAAKPQEMQQRFGGGPPGKKSLGASQSDGGPAKFRGKGNPPGNVVRVRQVRVTTGAAKGDFIAVDGDLEPGQKVVVTGNELLQPGAPVRVVNGGDRRGALKPNGRTSQAR